MTMATAESPARALRLPKISREAIARGLSEIQVSDLTKIDRPNIEMPAVDLSKTDLPRVEVGKAVADAAVAFGIARPSRPRWPFLVGAAVIAGLTAWAVMSSTSVRERLDRAARNARGRIDEMREAGSSLNRPFDVASALEEAGVTPEEYSEVGTQSFEESASRV